MVALKNLNACVLAVVVVMIAGAGGHAPRAEVETWLRGCPVDQATVVRVHYYPANSNYVHYPIVFRPVPQGDPRLDTVPLVPEGRTAYISMRDMRHLLRTLAAEHLL